MFPDIIPSIERDRSTRSTSPSLSTRKGSWTSCSSPIPPPESLASRSYSHDGTTSPLGLHPRRLETPRYISAPRLLSASSSPSINGVPSEPHAVLLPPTLPRRRRPTFSPSASSRAIVSPGFRLGRRAAEAGLLSRIEVPEDPDVAASRFHRPPCPCCGCVCGPIQDNSQRSGGREGTARPTTG
ncbi:hypothetical protein LY78DRAFT_542792, partial [Colletotrichum sublineola]